MPDYEDSRIQNRIKEIPFMLYLGKQMAKTKKKGLKISNTTTIQNFYKNTLLVL